MLCVNELPFTVSLHAYLIQLIWHKRDLLNSMIVLRVHFVEKYSVLSLRIVSKNGWMWDQYHWPHCCMLVVYCENSKWVLHHVECLWKGLIKWTVCNILDLPIGLKYPWMHLLELVVCRDPRILFLIIGPKNRTFNC